ncbi:MAG TPA: hypothetical protein GX692_00310 [Acholeplasmataceae bacterium]|nr:hypothetical protein [Acholeplasmataceae bacterium]
MRKKLSILFLLALTVLFIACGNQEEYSFGNPKYPLGFTGNEAPAEEEIVFDGQLTESFYSWQEYFEFTKANDSTHKMVLTTVFFDSGLLIGVQIKDPQIYYNSLNEIYKNDSFELYINPTEQKNIVDKDFVQLRVSATNEKEMWIGTPTGNEYGWSRFYVPFSSAVHVDGTIIDTIGKDVEENYNSVGYTAEVFIPWTSLSHDSKPETIDIFPAFVDSFGFGSNDFGWNSYQGLSHMDPINYLTFDENGYADKSKGSIFGDSDFGKYATKGFDLADETNQVIQIGGYDQYIYFKDIKGLKYGFTVDISNLIRLNNDPYPKVGVIVGENSERIVNFFFDPFPNYDNYYGVFVPRDRYDDNWQWGPGSPLPKGFSYYDKNTMTVIKDTEISYVFVNGILVDKRPHGLVGETQAGLFTMNMSAIYSNYRALTEAEIANYLALINFEDTIFEDVSNGFSLLEDGSVLQDGFGEQIAYFRDVNTTKYLVSTKVKLTGVLFNDPFPKVGIIAGSSAEGDEAFLIDPRPEFNIKDFLGVARPKGNDWDWDTQKLVWLDRIDYNNEIELTVVRTGSKLYYFVDGSLIYEKDSFLVGASKPGLITMNYEAIFSDFKITTDTTEVDAFLENYLFDDLYGWNGQGNFTIKEDSIYLNETSYDVAFDANRIINNDILLEGSFFIEYDLSQVRYAPMDWVWPKINLLLIDENNVVSDFAVGVNPSKQNRFETNVGGWKNWDIFEGVNWKDVNTIKIERLITEEGKAEFRLYLNGNLATISGSEAITTDYVGSYRIGLSFDYASGLITNLNVGTIE